MSGAPGKRNEKLTSAGLALLGLALILPRPAAAIVGDTDEEIGLDGSIRTIGAASSNFDISGFRVGRRADGSSETIVRLVLAGYPTDWLSYEVHAVQSVSVQTFSLPTWVKFQATAMGLDSGGQSGSFGAFGASGSAGPGLRYRAFDGRWRWFDGQAVTAQFTADRFNVKLALPFADVTLGRQAISFGKAYFWNPLDVFLSFDPTSFDREYKRGVDGLRVDIPIGDFSGVTVVGVLGRPNNGHAGYRSAGIVRVFTNFLDWDFSVQGGKVYGGFHAGLGASGELGPVEARAEAAYFWPLPDLRPDNATEIPEGLSAVLGVGRMFAVFDRTLVIQGEYLFNSAAGGATLGESFVLASKGLMIQPGEHTLGAMASYQVSALLGISFATMFSISEQPSILLQPGLVYSAADEVELLAGAMFAFGERPTLDAGIAFNSVYGSYPHVFYLEAKIYF